MGLDEVAYGWTYSKKEERTKNRILRKTKFEGQEERGRRGLKVSS